MSTSNRLQINQSLAAELSKPLPPKRKIFNACLSAIAFVLTVLALLPLLAILIEILRQEFRT